MWTSRSRKHASEHHPPLPSKPYVLIAADCSLGRFDLQEAAAARHNVDGQTSKSPFLNGAAGGHETGPAVQSFALNPPLVVPHEPLPVVPPSRDEVQVAAHMRERGSDP